MANDPGEWYAEKAEKAAAFRVVLHEAIRLVAHARDLAEKDGNYGEELAFRLRVHQWLTRELERAEYVGD